MLVKTPVNPLLRWLNAFFSSRSLPGADGRALYAYRCHDAEYESLAALLRAHVPRNYSKTIFISYSDVLFSIYAAEFIRRNHTAGHPRWDVILESIGWKVPYAHRQKLVNDGIRYWKRKVRSLGQASGYLHTLACEGGLPIRMIENESGYLITYFRRIYQALRGQSSRRPAEKIAQELGDTIPVTMQNELVYEIAGEFCETLHTLLNEHPTHGQDPVSSLRKQYPDWHLQLPLVLPEENASEIVRRLLSQSSEPRISSNVLVERIWNDVDDSWYCDARFRFPATMRTEQLISLFESNIQPEQTRLIISAKWRNGGARLAMLSRYEQQDWRVELLPFAMQKLSGADAMTEISLSLHERPILLGHVIPKGGYELTEDLPWVFEAMNESESQLKLVGMGSVSSRQNSLFISLPTNSHLDISGEGEFDIPRLLKNSERSLTKISGVFSVVLHDGAVCTIRTQQLYDSAIEYYIKPTEIDLVKSDYPVHRAWPKIGWKKDMQHGIVPENELFWRSIRSGNNSWFSVASVMPKGQIEVRRIVNGEVLFSGKVVILPADFDIQIIPETAQQGVIVLSGITDARVDRYSNNEKVTLKSDYLQNECVIDCNSSQMLESTINLRVSWKDGSNLKLLLPKPVSGGRFVSNDGSVHFDGVASIAHLHGVDAELLTISCAGKGYLNIELLDENPMSEKFHYLHADIPLLSGRNEKLQQISLYENYNLLNAMLACAWKNDSTLRVDFYSDRFGKDKTTLNIKRYDGRFIEGDERLLVDIKDSIVFPYHKIDDMVVEAISLNTPDLCTVLLKKDESGYDFSTLNNQGGPWLIVGKIDGAIRIAPVIKWMLPTLQTDDLFLNAICNASPEQRKEYCNALFLEMKNNPLQNSCYLLVEYIKKYKLNNSLPLLELDLFREISSNYCVVVQLLISSCLSGDSDAIYDIQEELPFSWGWIPVSIWKDVFEQCWYSLEKQINDKAFALNILQPFIAFINHRAHIDRRLVPIANMLLTHSEILPAGCTVLPSVSREQFNDAKQMLLRNPDSFGRVSIFSKELWDSAITPDLKSVFNKFWIENTYHTRFEKRFNLMLVAALLSQRNNKLMHQLTALFEFHYQQAPQQLGVIYQYYFEQAGVCH
ncbi:STY4851/ECs_5259 family protein [Hafnia alvei]|uniref:STY4851/ECs_5259 family protein n=1 Tax=Hafnia alvei TaxID=569 RepID=UPI00103305E2|nr:STY4851/ECs_5259 family protein [Hafnia alvei]TBL82827.1 hypothetical protein EYY88_19165 [Hafnia alvei]